MKNDVNLDHQALQVDGESAYGDGLNVGAQPMADFPKLEYPMREVRRAGDALKDVLEWSEDRAEELHAIFRIANNWRDSHAYPMAQFRYEMMGKIRSLHLGGLTVARLKRMRSIRKKLQRLPGNLAQIQDLGGCRAILSSIGEVHTLVDAYRGENRHELIRQDDYIAAPKAGGYRSQHLVYKFRDADAQGSIFDGRRIEIQVRTRLQHSWATAVEAVGTFRNEDMKGGHGDADWLRMFELMSAELAVAENCPLPQDIPDTKDRRREIRALGQKLGALGMLENLRQAVRGADNYVSQPYAAIPKYFLIKYDNVERVVDVQPYFRAVDGTASYDNAEQSDNLAGTNRFNTVLVEAQKIDALKEAYPNYFGDVKLFAQNLQNIVHGSEPKEYSMPPRIVEPPKHHEHADMSWMRRTGRRWFKSV
jgi:ppGpp synthetase/RelA/SpoT-type nucleotidyltranferase